MKTIYKNLKRIDRKAAKNSNNNSGRKDRSSLYSLIATGLSLITVIILGLTYWNQYVKKTFEVVVGINDTKIEGNHIHCNLHFSNTGNQNMTIKSCKFFYAYEGINKETFPDGYSIIRYHKNKSDKPFILSPGMNYIYNLEQEYDFNDIVDRGNLIKVKEKGKNKFDTFISYLRFQLYLMIEYYEMGELKYNLRHFGEIIFEYENVTLSRLWDSSPTHIAQLRYKPDIFKLYPHLDFSKESIHLIQKRNE